MTISAAEQRACAFSLRRSPYRAAILFATLSTLAGCDVAPPRATEPVVLAGQTMGTAYEAKFFGVEADEAIAELSEAMEAELAEIDRQMSTYRPDSEISRFNASDSTDWFEVSPGFEQVVRRSLEISAESDGAFDPTVMPLVRLWRFGPDATKSSTVPSDAEIAAAKAHVGYRLIETRVDPPAVRKSDPKAELDLNAVAPGYGVDRLGAILDQTGATSWYIELGGEIRTSGAKPDDSPWIVGIETPSEGERSVETFVRVVGEALATSGDYRKFYEVDGVRYSHTIDPTTGRPVLDPLASVSVLAKNCADADAYATAISALGEERGIRLAESGGLEVLLIVREEDSFRTRETPGFDERRLAP